MLYQSKDYRSYLKGVLAEKIGRNASFSMRAMAKLLGIAPSTFSEVLKGTKNLSPQKALEIGKKLGLSQEEQEYFSLLVQAESAKSLELKEQHLRRLHGLNPNRQVHDISVDVFKAISDWYHYPILELTKLDGFQFSVENIAKKLGISKPEVEVALERLLRLELLEKTEDGRYQKTHNLVLAKTKGQDSSIRNFHKQMLTKAIEALDEQDQSERWTGSETFAINPKDFPKANAITEKYMAEMINEFSNSKEKSEIYHLDVAFFRLTKKEEGKKKL